MVMKWQEVESSDRFLTATPIQQQQAKEKYFDAYAKPQFESAGADIETARQEFFKRTNPIQEATTEQQEYIDEKNDFYYNFMSEEEVANIKAKGDIGIYERAKTVDKWKFTPWLNPLELTDDINVLANIVPKMKDGTASQKEKDTLRDYMTDMAEVEIRGLSTGTQIVEGLLTSAVFGTEIGFALASAPVTGGASVAGTAAKATGKQALKATLKTLTKQAAKLLTVPLTKKGATLLAPRIAKSYGERYISESIVLTDKGDAMFKDADKFAATRAMQAVGDTYVEYWTEITGGKLLAGAVKPLAKPLSKIASKVFPTKAKELIKGLDKASGGVASKILAKKDRIAWNGFLTEFGEERLGGVMRLTLGLDKMDDTKPAFQNYLDAIVISPHQALVESGIILGGGGVGIVTNKLVGKMRQRGLTSDEIMETLDVTSQSEQSKMLTDIETEEQTNLEVLPQVLKDKVVNTENLTGAEIAQLEEAGVYPLETKEDIQTFAKEDINKLQETVSDPINKNLKKLQDIGFTEVASEQLVKQQLQIEELKATSKNIAALTKQEIKGLQTEVTDVINNAPISKEKQASFTKLIKNVQTPIQYKNVVSNIMTRIEEISGREIRDKYINNIDALLKTTKDKQVSGRKVGKFTYTDNKLFSELRRINKLTKNEAYDEVIIGDTLGDSLRRKLLSAKQSGRAGTSPELAKSIYEDMAKVEAIAKDSRDTKDFIDRMAKVSELDNVKSLINAHRGKDGKSTNFDIYLGDWKSTLNTIGGKKLAEEYNLIEEQKNEQVGVFLKTQQVKQMVVDAYGIKPSKVAQKIEELRDDNNYTLYYKDSTREPVKNLSRSNLISIYNLIKNDKVAEKYDNTFGLDQITDLLDNLTEQDINFAISSMEFFKEYYPEVNKAYVQLNDRDLPQAENYFPSRSEYTQENDLFSSYVAISKTPSFFKGRVEGNVIVDPTIDVYTAMNNYITQSEYIKNVGVKHRLLEKIFKDSDVQKIIRNSTNEKMVKNIKNKLDANSLNGINAQINSADKLISNIIGNWAGAKVGLSPAVFAKQLISTGNFAEDMPVKDFSVNFIKGIINPVETIKFMMSNSAYLRTRYKKGGDDAIARMLSDAESSGVIRKNLQKVGYNDLKVKEFMSVLQRTGDITAWIFGGNAKVKYLMEQGYDKKEAFRIMENEGLESQQSNLKSMMSDFQNATGAWKTLTTFKNTPLQYLRKMKTTVDQVISGDITPQDGAKKLVIYGVINPALFGYIGYMFSTMGDEEDDEENEAAKAILYSMAVQPTSGVPFISTLVETIAGSTIKGRSYGASVPVIDELVRSISNTYNGKLDIKPIELMTTITETITGMPIKNVLKYGEKIGKATGKIKQEKGRLSPSR